MTSNETVLVGVDCATDPRKVGLARASRRGPGGLWGLDDATTVATWQGIEETVADWFGPVTLLALDAPLGWPVTMGDVLHGHAAGKPLGGTPNGMFRRATDNVIAARIGKRPLDVGADRIARTAHCALAFLGALRQRVGHRIELASVPGPCAETCAIEVYPAASLAARGWPSSGYKGSKGAAPSRRESLVEALSGEMVLSETMRAAMHASDHVLDAALCCLAAADFLEGDVLRPTDADAGLAAREGWIWVRSPAPDE